MGGSRKWIVHDWKWRNTAHLYRAQRLLIGVPFLKLTMMYRLNGSLIPEWPMGQLFWTKTNLYVRKNSRSSFFFWSTFLFFLLGIKIISRCTFFWNDYALIFQTFSGGFWTGPPKNAQLLRARGHLKWFQRKLFTFGIFGRFWKTGVLQEDVFSTTVPGDLITFWEW